MTRTLIIYSEFEQLPKFKIVDGDYSALDGKIVNFDEITDEEDRLFMEVCGEDCSKTINWPQKFPIGESFNKVANCGFAL